MKKIVFCGYLQSSSEPTKRIVFFLDGYRTALGQYYLEDGLHPNDRGHRLMAGAAADLLRNWFHFQYK